MPKYTMSQIPKLRYYEACVELNVKLHFCMRAFVRVYAGIIATYFLPGSHLKPSGNLDNV